MKIQSTLEASMAKVDVNWDAWATASSNIFDASAIWASSLGLGVLTWYGSVISGVGSSTSDIDFDLDTPEGTDQDEMMKAMASVHESCGYYVMKLINHKAPELKMFDKASGVQVDVTANSAIRVQNTWLTRAYASYDPRGRALMRVVNEWARSSGLIGTSQGLLGSNAWYMKVIFFLQSPAIA